jgi:hypothetical protein
MEPIAIITIIILIIIWIIAKANMPPRLTLHQKFISLGNFAGKTEEQIVKIVGLPSSRSAMPMKKKILQWQSTGYHIALLFDAKGICEGISHEFVARK